jgi:uncharacterized protein (TIGR01244 family)
MAATRPLDAAVSASAQVRPDEIETLAAAGFGSIINNRPDDEEPGQPASAEIEAAALAAGLTYLYAPAHGMPDSGVVSAVAAQLKSDAARGARTLMFCRSGLRSAAAWAMAKRQEGVEADALRDGAAAAGYDLGRLPL